ncbi:MAG TPA: hypothetical protein VGB43_07225, partial [Flavobacterium sp.]
MKFNYLKSIAAIALFSGAVSGCINDEDFAEPVIECAETTITANKQVSELVAAATGLPTHIEEGSPDIIEAYVTS